MAEQNENQRNDLFVSIYEEVSKITEEQFLSLEKFVSKPKELIEVNGLFDKAYIQQK